MKQYLLHLNAILVAIFVLALAAAGYCTWQLRRSTPPQPAGLLSADKGYGVTVELAGYDDEARADILNRLPQAGLTWLRLPVNWAELEPAPGRFDWQSLDRVMAGLEGRPELKIIAVLQTSPAWTRPAGTPAMTPPGEVSDFGNFARAVAVRYGRQVDYYQVWHEPNLSANWGQAFVDPAAYAGLLREAALNIRAADPIATLLTAALAPTLENGPLNLNELAYLDQLYQARADRWFDIVAGQPYGFKAEPADPPRAEALNFRRLELLRQVMLAHGAAETPIWATAFGWNALPDDWAGRPSPWHSAPPPIQARRTAEAIAYARRAWPWLGPMLAIRWDTAGLAADDPARGFALAANPDMLLAMQAAAANTTLATAGRYPADHPSGQYSSGWRFALGQADVPRQPPRTLTISFEGTRLDLRLNRGPYRGYLWVTVDGQPATLLPQDEQGRSYVVLYDPLRGHETVTLARYLPAGRHQVVLEAEGGWGQWAVEGWQVATEQDTRGLQAGVVLAGLLAALAGLGLGREVVRRPDMFFRTAWAWSERAAGYYAATLGGRSQLGLTFGLALSFYLAPAWAAPGLLGLLALAILLHPDLGLAVVAFSLSFFQAPRPLLGQVVSPVELALALSAAGFGFQAWLALARRRYALSPGQAEPAGTISQSKYPKSQIFYPKSQMARLSSGDWAALVLVGLALAATLAAENFGVSMREWRVVVFESVIFYFLVRLGQDFDPAPAGADRWAWRLVDAWLAGAVLQALLALYLYFFTGQSITAEGVRRAMGLAYGSPNNLSLFLDRAWPVLLAVAVFPAESAPARTTFRRWLYSLGLAIVSLTLYLTFSKGALLLGLPASLVVMAMLYTWRNRQAGRRIVVVTVSVLLALSLALVPLSQTPRFRTLLAFDEGSTGFFRLKLWRAALVMLRDHWPLGVGLDNFLYQYRTRYILPDAWQEPNLSHPHNLVLDFGTRLGLGGIALLAWLQIAFWRNTIRLYRRRPAPLVLGLAGSMAAFLAHGLVDNSYFLVDLAFIFFMSAGIIQRLVEQPDH